MIVIIVDQCLVEIVVLAKQVWHDLLIWSSWIRYLCGRSDDIFGSIPQLIGNFYTAEVATITENKLHFFLIHSFGNSTGHRRDIHPIAFWFLIHAIGTCTSIRNRVIRDEPTCAMSPKHHAVTLGRILGAHLSYDVLHHGRICATALFHVNRVNQYPVFHTSHIWLFGVPVHIDNQVLIIFQ